MPVTDQFKGFQVAIDVGAHGKIDEPPKGRMALILWSSAELDAIKEMLLEFYKEFLHDEAPSAPGSTWFLCSTPHFERPEFGIELFQSDWRLVVGLAEWRVEVFDGPSWTRSMTGVVEDVDGLRAALVLLRETLR